MMAYAWWCLWSILSTYLHIFIQDIHILLPITLLDWNPFRKSEFLKLIIVDDYYSNFCKFLLEMVFGMFCTSCQSSFFLCLHFLCPLNFLWKILSVIIFLFHPLYISREARYGEQKAAILQVVLKISITNYKGFRPFLRQIRNFLGPISSNFSKLGLIFGLLGGWFEEFNTGR